MAMASSVSGRLGTEDKSKTDGVGKEVEQLMFSTRRWKNSATIVDQGEREFNVICLLEGRFQVKAFSNRLKRKLFGCVAFSTNYNKE
jgi:hypothetical protein